MQAALRDALEWQGRRASPRLLVWCTFRSEGRSRLAVKAKGTRGVPCRAEQVPHPLFLMQLIKPSTGGGPDSSPHLSLQHLGCSGKAGVGAGPGGQAAGPTPAATHQTSPGRSPPPRPARTQQQQRRGAPGEDPQAPRSLCAFQKLDFPSTHTAQSGSQRHQPHSPEAQKQPGNHSKKIQPAGSRERGPCRTRPLPTPTPTLPRRLAKQDHCADSKALT